MKKAWWKLFILTDLAFFISLQVFFPNMVLCIKPDGRQTVEYGQMSKGCSCPDSCDHLLPESVPLAQAALSCCITECLDKSLDSSRARVPVKTDAMKEFRSSLPLQGVASSLGKDFASRINLLFMLLSLPPGLFPGSGPLRC